ncbi:GTPase HflX [Orenia marismortui]|uniref:GTPase HflX n=1 Tax=Orenia marismortui TaxID=46469 RepID=A0A4R8H6H0_9FIRM|nr:GTPase HflX [Orenia marismortui]TDX53176.1 GTP-binding protein HflX [Orenia marismortui]
MAKKNKAIVIGVKLKGQEDDFDYLMEELKGLATACNIEVVGELSQNLAHINNSQYLGSGKIRELGELVGYTAAQVVIANDELSPSQIRVLEDRLGVRVIDRTMLILDIFARRAKTREAKLQVEVARLQYMLPRLVGQRQYDRQGGGAGLVNRGAGETNLELSRRRIEDKIAALQKELESLVSQREIQRRRRKKSGIPIVSLVGYTNAGKSTLMNTMLETFNQSLEKEVFEKDMLFATLETSVRKINLFDNRSFLLTDTVGFINRLPHHLVKAFRSTLEEVAEADLIIHVVDYSDDEYQKLLDVTNKTLKEIGVKNIPIIYVFNKGDLTDTVIPHLVEDRVYLSAKERTGIDELLQLVSKYLFKDYIQCEMLIPYDQGEVVSYFFENANVSATSYEAEGTKLILECKESDYERYRDYVVDDRVKNRVGM